MTALRVRKRLRLLALAGTLSILPLGTGTAESAAPDSSPSAPSSPLTLMDCYRLALGQAETLKEQQERIEQAESRHRQVLGSVFPHASFHASDLFQDTGGRPDSGSGSNLTRRERPEMKFTLRQPLFSGFREFAAMASLKSEREKERLLWERASKLLYLDVARAFYLVISLGKDLANLDTLLDRTRERVVELKERERLGKSRPSEVISVESQGDAIQAQRRQAEGDKAAAEELLSFLTGTDVRGAALADDEPDPPRPPAEEALLAKAETRSDVLALWREVDAGRHRVKAVRGDLYPSADFLGNYYTKRVGTQRDIDWDALLSLEVPLYRGGTAKARIREAESQRREAELRLARLVREVRREVREALLRLDSSLDQAESLRSAFQKAEESYRLQVLEYRRGLVNNLEVLQALNDVQERKRDLDRALVRSRLHRRELDAAVEEMTER